MVFGLYPSPGRISAVHRVSLGIVRFHRVPKCGLHVCLIPVTGSIDSPGIDTKVVQTDGRSRASNFWIPTGGFLKKAVEGEKGMHASKPLKIGSRKRLTALRGRK